MKNMSKECRFVLECIRSTLTAHVLRDEMFSGIDFGKVCSLASSHRVMGLVFSAVETFKEKLPQDVFEKMSSINKMMIMSSVARNGAIDEVADVLKKNSIDFVLLKGAVLQNLYPEKYMRYSADTDILVREKDYKKTPALFKKLSYKFDSQNDKHYVFQKKPYVCVEIHKKLVSSEEFFDDVWENVENDGEKLVLKKEFELAYLLFHMAENFIKTAGMGIHSVADIYLYLKTYGENLDKKLLDKYLDRLGLTEFFFHIKKLGEIWFDGKEYDEFYVDLSRYIFAGGRSGNAVNAASGKISSERSLAKGKFTFLLSKLFLPYSQLKKIYPALEKAPVLLPVFWGMRICGIVFRPEHRSYERAKIILKKTDKSSIENARKILQKLNLEDKPYKRKDKNENA